MKREEAFLSFVWAAGLQIFRHPTGNPPASHRLVDFPAATSSMFANHDSRTKVLHPLTINPICDIINKQPEAK